MGGDSERSESRGPTRWPLWPFVLVSLVVLALAGWWHVWSGTILEKQALERLKTLPGVEMRFPNAKRKTLVPKAGASSGLFAWLREQAVPPPAPAVRMDIRAEAGREPFRSLPHVRGLITLNADGSAIEEADLRGFGQRENLDSLHLFGTAIGNAGLAHLAGSSLATLDLTNTQITDRGLTDLGRMPNLKNLNLHGTAIDGSGLAALRPLTGLTRLSLASTKVTDEGLKGLAGMSSLADLDLYFTPITDAAMDTIVTLPGLGSLSVAYTRVGDAGLERLKTGRTRWEELSFDSTRVTSAGLRQLPIQPISLNLRKTDVGDELVEWLAGRRNLRTLNLAHTRLTDEGLAGLREAKELRTLNLEGCRVTDRGIFQLLIPPEQLPTDLDSPEGRAAALAAMGTARAHSKLQQARLHGTDVSVEVQKRLNSVRIYVEITR